MFLKPLWPWPPNRKSQKLWILPKFPKMINIDSWGDNVYFWGDNVDFWGNKFYSRGFLKILGFLELLCCCWGGFGTLWVGGTRTSFRKEVAHRAQVGTQPELPTWRRQLGVLWRWTWRRRCDLHGDADVTCLDQPKQRSDQPREKRKVDPPECQNFQKCEGPLALSQCTLRLRDSSVPNNAWLRWTKQKGTRDSHSFWNYILRELGSYILRDTTKPWQ